MPPWLTRGAVSAANDVAFLRRVVALLTSHGAEVVIFGGWAEELLGLTPPRGHGDVDLLCLADDVATLDELIEQAGLDEIAGKRFPHKRAFELDGIMVELFLVQRDAGGWHTDFWGRVRHDWPATLSTELDGLPVATAATVLGYRAAHERLVLNGV